VPSVQRIVSTTAHRNVFGGRTGPSALYARTFFRSLFLDVLMSRLLICCALLGAVACETAPNDFSHERFSAVSAHATAEGAWRVRVLPISHECPEVGDLAPIRPGFLLIEQSGSSLSLIQPGASPLSLDAVGTRTWMASATDAWDECMVDSALEWRFDSLGVTGFIATYTAEFDLRGGCDVPADHCAVTYAIYGAR